MNDSRLVFFRWMRVNWIQNWIRFIAKLILCRLKLILACVLVDFFSSKESYQWKQIRDNVREKTNPFAQNIIKKVNWICEKNVDWIKPMSDCYRKKTSKAFNDAYRVNILILFLTIDRNTDNNQVSVLQRNQLNSVWLALTEAK